MHVLLTNRVMSPALLASGCEWLVETASPRLRKVRATDDAHPASCISPWVVAYLTACECAGVPGGSLARGCIAERLA